MIRGRKVLNMISVKSMNFIYNNLVFQKLLLKFIWSLTGLEIKVEIVSWTIILTEIRSLSVRN
jgi:hypothetical protein